MAWLYLLLAGVCEAVWVTLLKIHGGMSNPFVAVAVVAAVCGVPVFISLGLKTLPLSTGYFVFIGAAVLSVLLASVFLLNENITLAKGAFIALILVGVLGLKFLEGAQNTLP